MVEYKTIFSDIRFEGELYKGRRFYRVTVFQPSIGDDCTAPILLKVEWGYVVYESLSTEWQILDRTSPARAIRHAIKMIDEYEFDSLVEVA